MSEPSPTATPLSPSSTLNWGAFDLLWTELQRELIASAEDSAQLSTQLAALQIELDALRSSLEQSVTLYEASRASLERERLALAEALVERDRARLWAKVLGGGAAALGIGLAISLIF